MFNIHPSLLPSFTGLNTHRRAIEAGCKVAGATVHFVSAELDHGPIVAQAVVPVLADDDETTLAKRVLAAEHVLYPRAVGWFVKGELAVAGRPRHPPRRRGPGRRRLTRFPARAHERRAHDPNSFSPRSCGASGAVRASFQR